MRIRFRASGAVVTQDEFRTVFKNTSFPSGDLSAEILDAFNCDPVVEGEQPALNENQYAEYAGVEQINGVWTTKYEVKDCQPQDIAFRLNQKRQEMVVSPYQGKVALLNAGILNNVETIINGPNADVLARLAWDNAKEWRRLSPMILSLATAIGLTDAQVDELFVEASKVSA